MDPELIDEMPPEARQALEDGEREVDAVRVRFARQVDEIRTRADAAIQEIEQAAADEVRVLQRRLHDALKPIQDRYAREGKLDEALAVRERVRALRAGLASAQSDPGSLTYLGDRPVGTRMLFDVTGDPDAGTVWGTDVYTHDSALAAAAVHAGALVPGERALVRVTWVETVNVAFVGSERHGARSSSFGPWPVGFRVERA